MEASIPYMFYFDIFYLMLV